MSKPRPIHLIPRAIQAVPDEAEPSFSYEQESFLSTKEEDAEDEFHRRLAAGSRREYSGGTSFWRTTTNTSNGENSSSSSQGPYFSSVSISAKLAGGSEPNSSARADRQPGIMGDSTAGSNNRWTDTLRDSSVTAESTSSRDSKKKEVSKQRAADRRLKLDAQLEGIDSGDTADDSRKVVFQFSNLPEMRGISSLDRSSSAESTGSLLYGKTPTSTALLGKSSSLIFPTGIDSTPENDSEATKLKRRKVNLALDNCEAVRFRFQKKLMLDHLDLTAADIPLKDLCGTSLGNSLHKLSLAGNRLGTVPPKLVRSLPVLKHLDLSQCELTQLPEIWNLPKLARLNLSHNGLTDFPEEKMLEGLPELQELNMYGNKVAEIIIPSKPDVLSRLEKLDLGYNDLVYLPPELDQIKSLKTLRVMNNFLAKVPMRICDMDLKSIDVSSNPITEPPTETCERGICSMRRYWHCIKMEEQSRQKAVEAAASKVQKGKTKKKYSGLGFMSLGKSKACQLLSKSDASEEFSSTTNTSILQPTAPISSVIGSSRPNVAFREIDPRSASKFATNVEQVYQEDKSRSILTDIPTVTESAVKAVSRSESLDEVSISEGGVENVEYPDFLDEVTVNDTLKVIFVGMAMVGKTSMIKRLIEGESAVIPTREERTVGVDIYQWDPVEDKRFEHIDSRIEFHNSELAETCGDVNVKFSVWDFAGQHVYHATHELFFSPRALYVLVWDMGATNPDTFKKENTSHETGAFSLSFDASDEEDDDDDPGLAEEEADKALERDIDEKVQFWVDCIQSSAPGAAILPVASFSDFFVKRESEAKRRCAMLKQRLLLHEERRINGLEKRLQEYHDQNRANDPAAGRLRKLLCPYTRPKLIFGSEDDDCVVQVSGAKYSGFDRLTERIINIAAGRYKGQGPYPIFHGHVGARIPRMRLEVREEVREMRDEFKVVEWGHFTSKLRERGLTNLEDISDALHFLTNTGELSYFGSVMTGNKLFEKDGSTQADGVYKIKGAIAGDEEYDADDDRAILSMDDTVITTPLTEDGSLTTVEDFMSYGLSQFVFLNPRWLVAAVACILRHDLDREIKETRKRRTNGSKLEEAVQPPSFYDAHLNCPVITAEDACLLWQAKRITKLAAKKAQEYSNNMSVTPFEFMQLLLIRFGVFVPIDLSIEKAFLGGKEYAKIATMPAMLCKDDELTTTETMEGERLSDAVHNARFFFLPSLLGPSEPSDAWTYKTTDSWKTTLCHSILYPDGIPPGLMERLTACVLSSLYAVTTKKGTDVPPVGNVHDDHATFDRNIQVKEILCWRTAFFVKIATRVMCSDGTQKESIVDIFTHLADKDSHLCVGSNHMRVGTRRLITSGRGQVGDGGKKIWKGGYLLVLKCIQRVMEAYGGLEFEKQGVCPECLAKKPIADARVWDQATIRAAAMKSEWSLRCPDGHLVDIRMVAGPMDFPQSKSVIEPEASGISASIPVKEILRAVVLVGLWDGRTRKVVRVGSGFIVDRKRGLIVTASHTLINIWGDKNFPYGQDYYGLQQGKAVIGVIPDQESVDNGKYMAVFRYFAKIVAKDPCLDNGSCHLDVCVLRITTRMENDVTGQGEGCGDQPEILLLNDEKAMKKEQLLSLKVAEKCELDEQVRILGYNQGGEGLLGPGEILNRSVDFAKGYVCQMFTNGVQDTYPVHEHRDRFKPRQETVVMCPTIGGHSGGPCVNQQGEVIGILSRADPTENQRCYISPTSEWKSLVKQAKYTL